jgi:hypothetical protein
MFEITSDEIALLNDEDLRSLIGRLCESEMRRRGISPSCVRWGGNQNAADGGLDVRVDLPEKVEAEGFIPRPNTGFQVKAEDTPASKIDQEIIDVKPCLTPLLTFRTQPHSFWIFTTERGSKPGCAAMQEQYFGLEKKSASRFKAGTLTARGRTRQEVKTANTSSR